MFFLLSKPRVTFGINALSQCGKDLRVHTRLCLMSVMVKCSSCWCLWGCAKFLSSGLWVLIGAGHGKNHIFLCWVTVCIVFSYIYKWLLPLSTMYI